jgi:hypothetical protein
VFDHILVSVDVIDSHVTCRKKAVANSSSELNEYNFMVPYHQGLEELQIEYIFSKLVFNK